MIKVVKSGFGYIHAHLADVISRQCYQYKKNIGKIRVNFGKIYSADNKKKHEKFMSMQRTNKDLYNPISSVKNHLPTQYRFYFQKFKVFFILGEIKWPKLKEIFAHKHSGWLKC